MHFLRSRIRVRNTGARHEFQVPPPQSLHRYLPRLTKFYQQLFDLGTIRDQEHTRVNAERTGNGYSGNVDFLTDGAIEFHWAGATSIPASR